MSARVAWRFRKLPGTTSTQDVLRELARLGEPEGLVVSAPEQSSGRGRHGRAWISPKGGLYMSVLLRPRRSSGLQLITMIAALAVVNGIRSETGVECSVRWPNDVVIEGKKIAGVLAEADYRANTFSHLVLGLGVNCNFRAERLEGVSTPSTTLLTVLGRKVRRAHLRRRIMESIDLLYSDWKAEDDAALVHKISERLGTLGKQVTFETIDGHREKALAVRLQDDGSLVVKCAGTLQALRGEQVAWLREE
jgi:BirA family transcriptional regulator, biotin operon repressor / biotin---[acetyl-CoA-carboxylase] ligase